jgi:hypothetical protein
VEGNMSDTEDTTATGTVATETTEAAPAAPSVADLLGDEPAAKAATGPSAEERGFQSRFNRLNDSIKPLKAYIDNPALGGAKGVATILANTERIWSDPELASVLQTFLTTGKKEFPKPARTAQSFDTFEDAEETPPWKAELEKRDAEINGLKQMLNGVARDAGMRSITDHTAKFRREYPMTADEQARFEEAMDARIDRLASTPQGVQVLRSMTWDDYRSIALPAIEDFRDAISERKRNQQRAANAQRATDAPGIGTGGDESQTEPMPRNRAELKERAKRALRAVQG